MKARNWLLFCVTVAGSILAGCSQGIPKAPYLSPPDLIDQLANADLSPAGPVPATASINGRDLPSSQTRAEMYPGSGNALAQRKAIAGISEARDGHFELNFADAELSELAKVIFRDTLNKPYVFDQRVQGRVTISTGGPVSRNELLAVFEAVLQMNRAALISDGTLYRIVPDSDRSTQNVSIFDYRKESGEIGPGYGVTIMVLNHVSSETMMTMLEQLSSGQDALRASVYNNLLIVRGTAAERQSLLELAAMFDVNWMKNQSAAIFTLANAAPDEVISELQQVFKAEEQGKGLIRFKPIARLNAILALSDKAALLRDAGTWIQRLDRGGAEAEGYHVYRVENGRAKDLAALLTASFAGGSGPSSSERPAEESEVAPTLAASRTTSSAFNNASNGSNNEGGSSASPLEKRSSFAPEGLLASSRSDNSSNTSEATTALPAGNDASGIRITADERNNTLLIKASGRKYREILGVLRKIDRPPMQVLINATLAEVTLNDNLEYGVQFFLQKTKGLDGAIGFTNGQSIDIAPAVPGLNFIIGAVASNPKVVLDALAKETAVRVVSSPSVVVLHNQPATLQVGDQVPVSTKSATSLQASDPVVVNEIEFKNTGVILNVTPRINSNGLVTMEVEQEISSVARSANSDTLTPTISQRRITSTIAVQSGQMVVLGGLISELADQQKSRVPVVDKIPYLGDVLGGNTQRGRSRTELVVFLRPSVIRNPGDASNVAEAVRASMQSLAPQPAAWDMNVKPVK